MAFDLLRIMRSRYRIDAYQETYFVIDSFQQLFDATAPDFAPLYRELATLEELEANAALPGDRLVPTRRLSPGHRPGLSCSASGPAAAPAVHAASPGPCCRRSAPVQATCRRGGRP